MANNPFSSNPHAAKAHRQGKAINSAVTLPTAHAPECKVHFDRPMPCVVILIHGVNDVGEAFSTQAEGICEGLNARLGRADLTPGEWDTPKAGQCGPGGMYSYRRSTAFGKNPIIPFYWGYRPVDQATYKVDKERYRAELEKRGPHGTPPEAPYDAYHIDYSKDPDQGYQRKDNYGNPLNEQFCKGGGVFANATTNLIDMWLEGSDIIALAKSASNLGSTNKGDFSHSMHTNPHRIYMVYAAQRLANLILAIRKNPKTKDDSINIVAHSQGTLVTLLANFLVKQAANGIYRPADCVIFNNSPYSFVNSTLDALQNYGPQQSVEARIATFANFCKLLADAKMPAPLLADISKAGLAYFPVFEQVGYGRDNHGKVYNYFSPHDKTVALSSIQGIGWQGVRPEHTAKLGSNFKQRMFFDNEPVWMGSQLDPHKGWMEGVRTVPFPKPDLTPGVDAPAPIGEIREISGEPLPMPFTFELAKGCNKLGPSDYPIQEAEQGADTSVWKTIPDFKPDRTYPPAGQGVPMTAQEIQELEASLKAQGKNWTVVSATILPGTPGRILVNRYETPEEIRARTIETKTENSYHSSLVLDKEVSEKVVAFDLAIGRCQSYDTRWVDGGAFWNELIQMADWRHSKEKVDAIYRQSGVLPPKIKLLMNKPGMGPAPEQENIPGSAPAPLAEKIPGIVNETNQVKALKGQLREDDRILKYEHDHPRPPPTWQDGYDIGYRTEAGLQLQRNNTQQALDNAEREQNTPTFHLDK